MDVRFTDQAMLERALADLEGAPGVQRVTVLRRG
jgi:hypothetical protein